MMTAFVLESGNQIEVAQNISNVAQQSGYKVWSQIAETRTDIFL
jgi:hypothetical protein